MNSKRIISLFLTVALVGVWGTIIYRAVDGDSTDENAADRPGDNSGRPMTASARYAYFADVRDPFVTPTSAVARVSHDSSRNVHFLSEKDTLEGILITRIDAKKVSYLFHGRKSEWVLE